MQADDMKSPAFWKSIAPGLHIADLSFLRDQQVLEPSVQDLHAGAELMRVEGYFQGSVGNWGADPKVLADTVRALCARELSPVFAFIYDEFWLPFHKLHRVFENLLGGRYYLLPDFWVWNVDPQKGESGWRPHRDKGYAALLPNRSPKSLTTWIPLSTTTPLNGCMYIVPAMLDPTYGTDQDKEWRFEFSSIRALPGGPGDFFIWNQSVLHWGSKTSPRAPESRVSMAFEFQRADVPAFNAPLIDPLINLSFEQRLNLIAKQILQYRHMYKLEPNVERMALSILPQPVPAA